MKLPDQDTKTKDYGLLDWMDFVRLILNTGRYEFRVVSAIPTWVGNDGEVVLVASGTTRALYAYINGAWKSFTWEGPVGFIFVLENRTDDPTSPETGRVWFRTDV